MNHAESSVFNQHKLSLKCCECNELGRWQSVKRKVVLLSLKPFNCIKGIKNQFA